jgi:hypothetical protein
MIQPSFTKKRISFIDDLDFRILVERRLNELDQLLMTNASYSIIFLAISTLEGIFKHIAAIFKMEISGLGSYPLLPSGKKKPFDKLTIDEIYDCLTELSIIPKVDNFEHLYKLFRDYRNFIHPQAERTKKWAIGLGQAEMALGLLNSSIDFLCERLYIRKHIFQVIEGDPDYYSDQLDLKLQDTPLNSCVVLNTEISSAALIEFDLQLAPRAVFNFIFNYRNTGDFKMLRLDNRTEAGSVNDLLHCTQKYFWRSEFHANIQHPPKQATVPVKVEIDFSGKIFLFEVAGVRYQYQDAVDKAINLFSEIEPGLKIGFFNEVRPVRLFNVKLKHS